jgi:hypothetical protein
MEVSVGVIGLGQFTDNKPITIIFGVREIAIITIIVTVHWE